MKRREPTTTTNATCYLCSNGKPDTRHDNLDIEGKPILVICPHSERKRLRTEKPCKHFNPKEV